MADRHKTKPKAVRMPDGLLAWYEQHAAATGRSVNAALVGALEEHRAQHDSGSTTPPAPVAPPRREARQPEPAPAARFREPESASDIMAALRRRREAGRQ